MTVSRCITYKLFIIVFGASLTFAVTGHAKASEVILTAENLNSSLKNMQVIQRKLENAKSENKPELLFQLGLVANDLAMTLTNEVVVYDMQQKGLIGLAAERTRELGIHILWYPDKKRFIYDGSAFREYLVMAPGGTQAGESAFQLLNIEFFQSSGEDAESILATADRKREYLKQFPTHPRTSEVELLLAIDYRDLWRLYQMTNNQESTHKYYEHAIKQFQWVAENYSETKHGNIASGLLRRLEQEHLSLTNQNSENTFDN